MADFAEIMTGLRALTDDVDAGSPVVWDGVVRHLLSEEHVQAAVASVEAMAWAKRHSPFVVVYVCHLLISGIEGISSDFRYFPELEAAVRRLAAEISGTFLPKEPP